MHQLIERLVDNNLLTEEKIEIIGNGYTNGKGKITIGSKTIVFIYLKIADVVSIGDFINYDAGIWNQDDINKLGQYYAGKTIPVTDACKFGGLIIGDSKNKTITPNGNYINSYKEGWRVLSKNEDGTVNLVHAGTPEAYCQEYGTNCGYKNQFILSGEKNDNDDTNITDGITPRNWSMYEDNKYAVKNSARILKDSEVKAFRNDNDIRSIGVYYWAEIAEYSSMLRFFSYEGTEFGNQYWNACFGIRPVVKIKAETEVDGGNNTTHNNSETAWKLLNE